VCREYGCVSEYGDAGPAVGEYCALPQPASESEEPDGFKADV
jgi:hypothetical protein